MENNSNLPMLKVVKDDNGQAIFECSGAGISVRHQQEWQAIAILRQLYVAKGLTWPGY